MTRRDVISKTAVLLREAGLKKTVSLPKQTFTVSDESGNEKKFSIPGKEKDIIYTIADIDNILEAFTCVIEEAIQTGEKVDIRGFGTFGVTFRPERYVTDINKYAREGVSEKSMVIKSRYIPKFTFGNRLRMAAQVYTASLADEDALSSFPSESELNLSEDDK